MTRPTPEDDDPSATTRRVPLTRERVLAAALRLVDDEGLDALTRRRLGQELGRDAMALYRHAPDRAALLEELTNWPTFYPAALSDDAIVAEMLAH